MRRAILAVIAGGTLLTGAACDSDARTPEFTDPVVPSSAAAPSPSISLGPDYTADTSKVCGRVTGIVNAAFGEFGAELGRMIANRQAKETAAAEKAETTAAAELKAIGTQIRKETAAAEDPELTEAGETSAAKIEAAAKNRDYIEKLKSTKDLDVSLKDQIAEWLDPVSGYCAAGPLPSESASPSASS
ncbi:hypothetical protein [Actinoplanes derwentensis]|uniref:Uncharacterized protein n=1 Tax=Actinoplanes derwentensis TaxID=113562 RepID=A0A1H2CYR9_9ACTN|nr:hypothetical protein [Actinoplanes derwentensis]GID82956.1 hypothetical protein Ade03nite_18800 [Actinoplanes derwentensis]SDT75561.1 hypothetical protein SAMN04489716_7339 [Actinoplanes derwentensis]